MRLSSRVLTVGLALAAMATLFWGMARAMPAAQRGGAAPTPPALASATPADPGVPFYGTQYVPVGELAKVRSLGFNLVLTDFSYEEGPEQWRAYLDAAHGQGLRVIPWLWPEGWRLDRRTGVWTIDAQARRFLETVSGHPALLAVYGLHEPYWNECEGCGYTTAQQQALYSAIKAIAPVQVYSEINGFAFWEREGAASTIAPGVCDYCQTAFYPFMTDGSYRREELIAHIEREVAALRRLAPGSRLIWTMPSMSHREDRLRMPSGPEMLDYARLVYARPEISGAWWYMWRWDNDLYPDYLAKHPSLHPAAREIADTVVAPLRPTPAPATPAPPSPGATPKPTYAATPAAATSPTVLLPSVSKAAQGEERTR